METRTQVRNLQSKTFHIPLEYCLSYRMLPEEVLSGDSWDSATEEVLAGCEGCVVIDGDSVCFDVAEASFWCCDRGIEGDGWTEREDTRESVKELGPTKVQGNKTKDASLNITIVCHWHVWALWKFAFVSWSQRKPFFFYPLCWFRTLFFLLKPRHFQFLR